ncbi:MAG: hypothetical protein H8E27_01910 [Verrucomicrobia subdivision 3 bacterium]|nr:hypothetical protein [Limisphaerales bacterium]
MSFPPESLHPGTGDGLPALEQELRAHLTLCGELLAVVQREHQQLKTGQVDDLNALLQAREGMLERLTRAQETLFTHKDTWMALNPTQREQHPTIAALIRQDLDLIMKIVSLDRENEQLLLRHKLVPANHLPPAQRQNPNLIARMYKDQP